MNSKTIKIISSVILAMMIIMTTFTVVNADDLLKPNQISANYNNDATTGISNFSGEIIGALQTVGIALSVIMLVVLGIKYMVGSAEEKAEYKKSMMPYVIGAILIFGASVIAGFVVSFVQ